MSSKKGKKSKGVTMSLQDFALKVEEGAGGGPTPGSGQNIIYADKKPKLPMMSSWADEVEEDGSFFEKERLFLPSAPRASRGPAYDDSEIPRSPPFTAHLGNLPYDISDEDIYKFFREIGIDELKLPRDPQTQRLRGFGYVDFQTRDDLIQALIKNEQTLRGRPIRITLGNGQQDRRGGDMDRGGMRGGGEDRRRRPPAEDDDVDDWRSVMKPQGFEPEQEFRRGPPSIGGGPGDYGSMPRSGGYNRDRGYGGPRERGPRGPPPGDDLDFSRSQMMQGPPPGPPPQHYNTYGGRGSGPRGGGYQQRDRDYYDNRGGGDRYGGGGGDQSYYRGGGGGPPSGPPSHNYPPSTHSRHHSESSDAETGGTWRRGREPREHTMSQSSQSSSHNYGPPSNSYIPPHHHQRSESPPMRRQMSPHSDYGHGPPERSSRGHRERDDDDEEDDMDLPPQSQPQQPQPPKERKRLVLQPRTVEKTPGEAEVGPASIFGGAKPVDTQKREREIEEKLEKLKVETEEPPTKETESSDQERNSGGESGGQSDSGSRREARGGGDRDREHRDRGDRDRDRGDRDGRPKPYRLLTRNDSAGKEAYIDFETPFDSLKGPGLGSALTSSAAASSSRSRLPMQQPPPLQAPPYGSQRFSMLRSDDKDRERGPGDRDRDRGGPYRGGRGGGMGGPRRGGDMDRGPRGDYRRGPPGGMRDHDGGRGGGRSYDRDHHGPPSGRGGGRMGYGRDGDYRGDRDDFRRGPPHNNNQQTVTHGSQSEERDRDSHSEPEDDRDMMRGGGDKGGAGGVGGDFSDDSGDFTRVERRRGKSYSNRINNNPTLNPNNNRPPPPRGERTFY